MKSIMASFSVKSFERKLKEMSSRQDSVQTVSLWLIHHRAHSKTVVNQWLERMKKAKPDRRLVLFYLANDVIQNSRKKGKEFSQSFGKVLGDSMQYLRDTSIRPSVERVLNIWQERKVFDKNAVQKLLNELNHVSSKPKRKSKAEPKVEPKIEPKVEPKVEPSAPKKESDKVSKKKKEKRPVPTNFKTINVTSAIATMQGIEDETERRQTLVSQMRLDASSSEGIKQLKDYAGGNRFSSEFEESSTRYEDLVKSLEAESEHRQTLLNFLEDGDAYYRAALKEASIIANAYRSFGNRLHSMKKKLDTKIRKFATAQKEAPVSAPKASFLASGLSGILEEMNRSPAATPNTLDQEKTKNVKEGNNVEDEEDKADAEVKEEKPVDPTIDHVEVSDMDIESDSENGDGKKPSATPQSSEDNSNVSTPKPATVLSTASPSLQAAVPAEPTTPQFGYTMTVNSSEDVETSSPTSHDSAPSPYGSPDLGLEIYEGPPATNSVASNQLGVMTNRSFLSNEQDLVAGSPGQQNTANLLAQLISKKRRQNDVSPFEGADSPAGGSDTLITSVRDQGNSQPLINLIGNIFQSSQLVHSQEASQSGDISDQLVGDASVGDTGTPFDPGVTSTSNLVQSNLKKDSAEAASKADSGPSTDEEGEAGDNTPEHGLEFPQGPPIVFRSETSFPRPPIPPNFSGPFPGQAFQSRPPAERPQFMSPEMMPRFPNERGMFIHDRPRRPSIEEQLRDEHHRHDLRLPRLRSPGVQGPPVEWERRRPPFGARGNIRSANNLIGSRDPRIQRREQRQIMGRTEEGPPFIDRIPHVEMRGGPSEMRGDPLRDRTGIERQRGPPMHLREREELEYINREEIMRRRLSIGDERDGPLPIDEREKHIREGHPLRREGFPPIERREGHFPDEMRDPSHPMSRFYPDVAHHIDEHLELRDGRPRVMREETIPPERIHPIDRHHSLDRNHPVGNMNEFHPPEKQDQLPSDPSQQFHPPEEVPTSTKEECGGEKKSAGSVPPQEQIPDGIHFSEGGDERPPIQDDVHPQIDNSENIALHDEMMFKKGEEPPFQNEQTSGAIRTAGIHSPEMRPGFHVDHRNPEFRFGGMDSNRPIRALGGHFGPRHERPGRFPGPRNFRHRNFGPRNFRPRFESDGGRPRFPGGGPHLKRYGPPFHGDPAKRPHY